MIHKDYVLIAAAFMEAYGCVICVRYSAIIAETLAAVITKVKS
jgi:hypothetical protein